MLGELWLLGNPRYADGTSISKLDSTQTIWQRGPGLGIPADIWQQNRSNQSQIGANEEAADMFPNWAYDVVSPVFQSNVPNNFAGAARRDFMNDRMTKSGGWIDQLVNLPFSNCQ